MNPEDGKIQKPGSAPTSNPDNLSVLDQMVGRLKTTFPELDNKVGESGLTALFRSITDGLKGSNAPNEAELLAKLKAREEFSSLRTPESDPVSQSIDAELIRICTLVKHLNHAPQAPQADLLSGQSMTSDYPRTGWKRGGINE